MTSKMLLFINVEGKADPATSLRDIQNTVAQALRQKGVLVTTENVRVEGRLA